MNFHDDLGAREQEREEKVTTNSAPELPLGEEYFVTPYL